MRRARRRVATRPGDAVLAAFGDDVGFTLVSGKRRRVDAPRTALMFFDDDGKAWPSCSLLIAKLQMRGTRPATDDEMKGLPGQWLGKNYEGARSTVDLPPKSLSEWTLVGSLARIWYFRIGDYAPGFFKHAFNKPTGLRRLVFLVKGKREVLLYKRRSMFRVELGKGCTITRSGLEVP